MPKFKGWYYAKNYSRIKERPQTGRGIKLVYVYPSGAAHADLGIRRTIYELQDDGKLRMSLGTRKININIPTDESRIMYKGNTFILKLKKPNKYDWFMYELE